MKRWLVLGVVALLGCSEDADPPGDDDGSGGAGVGGMGAGAGGAAGVGGMGGGGGSAPTKPVVLIETSLGSMTVVLEPELMPNTTENFLTYVDEGFYTNTIIHRVIPDFVIQGGGFTSGLTPKSATHPPIVLETNEAILHDYGAISMARTNDPNSATTQFFIVNAAAGAHSLDGSYAAFGRMTEGAPTLDAISVVPTETVGQYEDVPVEDVTVLSITRVE